MNKLLILFLTFWVFQLPAKVYDCFLFYNELDLLDIRLAELNPFVDRFVLVESIETFRGNEKPLIFEKNKQRYAKYLDKIIHVVVERIVENDPWNRETFQRNAILRGLKACDKDDIIILSDVDEIVRGSEVPVAVGLLQSHHRGAFAFQQDFYRWFFNRKDLSQWNGSVITTYKFFKRESPQGVRNCKDRLPKILNGGWHFSNFGGLQTFVAKIEAFSHAEADTPENKNPDNILNWVRSCLTLVSIDNTYPADVLERLNYFRSHNFLDLGQDSLEYSDTDF